MTDRLIDWLSSVPFGIAQAADEADVDASYGGIPTELWLLIALVALFAIGWKPLKSGILGTLDGRSERIRTELAEAEKLREDSQAALATYQRKQRDAMQEAEAILAYARTEAERIRTEAMAELEASLKRRERQAEERIEQAKQSALDEVRNTAVDVAVAAARQLVAERLSQDQATALIDQTISELPNRLH